MEDSPIILLTCLDQSGIRRLNYLLRLYKKIKQRHATAAPQHRMPKPVEVIGTPQAILGNLQQNKANISIFHFAGRQEHYQELLDASESQLGETLPKFLGKLSSLQLVFLNGCATPELVEALLDAGVPAVISTSRKLKSVDLDRFTELFYDYLYDGSSLDKAVADARTNSGYDRGQQGRVFLNLHYRDPEAGTWRLRPRIIGGWDDQDDEPDPDSKPSLKTSDQSDNGGNSGLPPTSPAFKSPGQSSNGRNSGTPRISPLPKSSSQTSNGGSSAPPPIPPSPDSDDQIDAEPDGEPTSKPGTKSDDDLLPLPPLDLPDKPFPGLRPYRREDARVFFGRNSAIKELCLLVESKNNAPVILLHGRPGVGKSSLLEAGLLPRLEGKYSICRLYGNQQLPLLDSLCQQLNPKATNTDPFHLWHHKEGMDNRPVLVVVEDFDKQFASPLHRQNKDLPEFLDCLESLFAVRSDNPRGKLILSSRSQRVGDVRSQLEQRGVFPKEFELNPLDQLGMCDAVTLPAIVAGAAEKYRLTVQAELPPQIARDLLVDKNSAQTLFLQIILDKMYRLAVDEIPHAPKLAIGRYENLRTHCRLLNDFFDQRMVDLSQKFFDEVKLGYILDILNAHVSAEGKAIDLSAADRVARYDHLNELSKFVEILVDLRLLAEPQDGFSGPTRLAHDLLAPLIRHRYGFSDGQVFMLTVS